MSNEHKYAKIVSENYQKIKDACRKVTNRNHEEFDEDIFQDTFLKIFNIIEKKGELQDMSENGIFNYFVKSYVNNLRCQARNSYVSKRDKNIVPEALDRIDENTSHEKIKKDLLTDFSALYLLKAAEINFPQDEFNLYKIKQLCNLTYKELQERTGDRQCRQKVLTIKNWLKNNITKDEINHSFKEIFGDI
jgi:hypothetical protein